MKRFVNRSKASNTTVVSRQYNQSFHDVDGTMTLPSAWSHQEHLWMPYASIKKLFAPSPETRDEMYVMYTMEHLCEGPLTVTYRNVLSHKSSHGNQSPVMKHCLLVLATIFYGIHNRQSTIVKHGMRLYGQALGMLSDVLGKDERRISTEVIVSVLSLSISEVCQS